MASPQLEDGHTQIANEILEHLMKLYLSPNQWQILICVIRKTYGYRKKVDYIANFQIMELTGLCKAVVSRNLGCLHEMNLITRKGKLIGFQKDWEKWKKLTKQLNNEKLTIQSTLGSKLAEQSTSKSLLNSQPELAVHATELAEQSTKVNSSRVTQKKKETIQKKLYKRNYGEFSNVLLTDNEYADLIKRFGDKGTNERIDALSLYIKSKGDKYKSHHATILNWERMSQSKLGQPTKRQFPTDEERRREFQQ